jgi:ELWxxDGT repeat protein
MSASISASAFAPASLVKDINPGLGPEQSSFPQGFTKVGASVFFVATDKQNGQELWKTNGTTGSTSLVMDITPGSRSSDLRGLIAAGEWL